MIIREYYDNHFPYENEYTFTYINKYPEYEKVDLATSYTTNNPVGKIY